MKKIKIWRAWLLVAVSLFITIYATFYVKWNIDKIDETEFKLQCQQTNDKIIARLRAHAQILRSGAAFFGVLDTVTREQWHNFVEHSKANENLTGIQGIGFSLIIPKDSLEKHIQKIRREGFPNYKISPEDMRDTYTSIIYLEPFSERNMRAFGYDMMTESVRKEAMERARDLDVAALSGKVLLVQETATDVQAGNLMYVPVYRKGAITNTLEQRRAAIVGWVYSPYRMNDLVMGIMEEWDLQTTKNLNLNIFDGSKLSPQSILFESYSPDKQNNSKNIRFSNQIPVNFNGHQWTLVFNQEAGNKIIVYQGAWTVLFGGVLISILLFFLAKSLIITNYKAQSIAKKLTVEIHENEKGLKNLNESLENSVNQRTSELQQTKGHLEYLLTSAPVVIYTMEVKDHFRVTYIGNNVKQIMGYDPEQFLSSPIFWTHKIHSNDRKYVTDKMKHILKKDNLNLEYRFLQNDGTYLWIHNEILVIKDENGKPTELLGYWLDITTRKKYEEKMQETLKEVSDYKIALDESSIVAITDQKGIINYVNDNFCNISKYTRDELIGKDHYILNSGFHPKEFFRDLWHTIAGGKIWKGEVKNKTKDGNFYWVDTVIVPFFNKKGKPYQYVTIRRDITEEKQLNEELVKAKDAADSANRAKSEFLANMSHEIRTPMNAIIGFSELLYNNTVGEKQRSQIASIHNSGKNLLKIINDILDLSKIEAGKLIIQKETVNIHQLAKDMEMIFSHKADEKDISFYIETESYIPAALLLDETRVRQILFNLLGNAIKFTEKGHVILTLDKKTKENNKIDLIIKIEDTGIGIPKAQQDKVFEAFSQQEGQINSKYGGTGLGLSITKRLAKIMGGTISLESEPGKGTVFTVYLPDVETGDLVNVASDKITFDPASIIFKEAKVLIVDDNKENRNLIIDLLENSPLTLFEAENGEEAVEIATKHLPDIILMDLRMPVMNGYEAINILKNQESTKSIPVIAISASVKILSKTNQLKETFDDFLIKPINLGELVQLLKKYLKYQNPKNNAIIKEKEPKKIPFELTVEQLKKLPELIYILENEFMPAYNKAIATQMIDRIEKFGKDLVVLAEKSSCKIILDYGNEICILADSFEIDKLIKILNTFPQIIKQIKSFIDHK